MFHLKFMRHTGETVGNETNISCSTYSVSRSEDGPTRVTSYADSTDTDGTLRYVTNDPSKYPDDVCVEGDTEVVEEGGTEGGEGGTGDGGTETACVEVFDVCYVLSPSGDVVNTIL